MPLPLNSSSKKSARAEIVIVRLETQGATFFHFAGMLSCYLLLVAQPPLPLQVFLPLHP